uniref:TNF receptor superfamily member 4 n=1 Tax=Pelodiscus sinensis TaxID=13735 RepID=K7F3K6_PELSI
RVRMVEQGLAKCICTFTAVLLFLLFSAMCCSGLSCGQNEYPLHGKCCKECAPGQEMKTRCTVTSGTECVPCRDGYYNSNHNYYKCKRCTACNAKRGRIEVKKCDKRSDAVCTCMRGYTLADTSSEESASDCVPCSHGHFSNGNNEKCQPWKNCTANGKKTLRAGTQTEDAICDDQGEQATTLHGGFTAPLPLVAPCPQPQGLPNQQGLPFPPAAKSSMPQAALLASSPLALLLPVAIPVAQGEVTCKPPDGKSFRIPIQEEQIDSNSSLIKN